MDSDTNIDEIAEGFYRIAVTAGGISPDGFTFNHFLVVGEDAALFHMGTRRNFAAVSQAVTRIVPVTRLRWVIPGHVEADECGALNQWLALSPQVTVAAGDLACELSIADLADRTPTPLADGETIDLGGRRLRFLPTPHVPHNWEAGLLFEETTRTLLCGDLFTQTGTAPTTDDDIVGPAIAAERAFAGTSIGPAVPSTLLGLADLDPQRLALMHGPTFTGDAVSALHSLAAFYALQLRGAEK